MPSGMLKDFQGGMFADLPARIGLLQHEPRRRRR